MKYRSRKIIKPEDLNSANTLFGGRLLEWVDEESAIYVMCQLGTHRVTTRHMSEIDFVLPARQEDIIEIGVETVLVGTTSITVRCIVRNKSTKQNILTIEKIVYVSLDENGKPTPHGKRK